MIKGKKLAGMAIAASAAALFIAGCANTGGTSGSDAQIACEGANKCKGMSDCKTPTSECAGMKDCKVSGFVKLSAVECRKVTGFDRPA